MSERSTATILFVEDDPGEVDFDIDNMGVNSVNCGAARLEEHGVGLMNP